MKKLHMSIQNSGIWGMLSEKRIGKGLCFSVTLFGEWPVCFVTVSADMPQVMTVLIFTAGIPLGTPAMDCLAPAVMPSAAVKDTEKIWAKENIP